MSKPKMADPDDGIFKPGNKLRHIKTGGFYKVVFLANVEATLKPAYVYESMQSHDFWIRPKLEMEDGRFWARLWIREWMKYVRWTNYQSRN